MVFLFDINTRGVGLIYYDRKINWDEVTLEPMDAESSGETPVAESNEIPVAGVVEVSSEEVAEQAALEAENAATNHEVVAQLTEEIRSAMKSEDGESASSRY